MKAQRFSDIPVAILCGGLASRLGERTIDTPKSIIKIAGKPFIRWQIEMLNKQGLTTFGLKSIGSRILLHPSGWSVKNAC